VFTRYCVIIPNQQKLTTLEKIRNLQSESRKEIGDKGLARLRMSHTGFLSLLGLTGNRKPKSESTAIAGGLRDLVMEQHRTLFYTVTISTPPAAAANPTPPSAERQLLVAPALKEKTLKWQCATSLSKSQSVISRTNRLCPKKLNLACFSFAPNDQVASSQQLQPLLHPCLSRGRRWDKPRRLPGARSWEGRRVFSCADLHSELRMSSARSKPLAST